MTAISLHVYARAPHNCGNMEVQGTFTFAQLRDYLLAQVKAPAGVEHVQLLFNGELVEDAAVIENVLHPKTSAVHLTWWDPAVDTANLAALCRPNANADVASAYTPTDLSRDDFVVAAETARAAATTLQREVLTRATAARRAEAAQVLERMPTLAPLGTAPSTARPATRATEAAAAAAAATAEAMPVLDLARGVNNANVDVDAPQHNMNAVEEAEEENMVNRAKPEDSEMYQSSAPSTQARTPRHPESMALRGVATAPPPSSSSASSKCVSMADRCDNIAYQANEANEYELPDDPPTPESREELNTPPANDFTEAAPNGTEDDASEDEAEEEEPPEHHDPEVPTEDERVSPTSSAASLSDDEDGWAEIIL